MASIIEQKLKQNKIQNSSDEFKQQYKLNSLNVILKDLEDNKNRFIFYCPDIPVVNSLTKLIYETAYEFTEAGKNVLILHEMNGFKPQWLIKHDSYKHLNKITLDYIIKKKGNKSKRTSNDYSFKPHDTLIVPDQFVEFFDNLHELKTLQKVLLINSLVGLSSIKTGVSPKQLGIDKVIFTDIKLAQLYNSVFTDLDSILLNNFPINSDVFKPRDETGVLPLISISNIGASDYVQQVLNIFYNKYPKLSFFNFRLLDRDNLELYVDNIKYSAATLILDKNLSSSQMIGEILAMGCPVLTKFRVELENELSEQITVGSNAFEVADMLAQFCQLWLTKQTSEFNYIKYDFLNKTYDKFKEQTKDLIFVLQENRETFFNRVKKSVNEQNS